MTPPPAAAAPAAYPRTAPSRPHPRRAPLAPARRTRRVSGPVAARAAAAAVTGAASVLPRPAFAPAPSIAVPRRARAARTNPAAVASHPLLDRVLHGRAWIGCVAFALIGIVTMQLGLLKLNAGIGRALEHEAALQRENAALSVEDSETAAGDTVELQAAHMGMQLIPEGALRFLSARGDEANVLDKAARALNARASAPSTASSSTTTATGTAMGAGESESESESGSEAESGSSEQSEAASASASSEAASPAGGEASAEATAPETPSAPAGAGAEAPSGEASGESASAGAAGGAASPQG
jgi:hypothetical protein